MHYLSTPKKTRTSDNKDSVNPPAVDVEDPAAKTQSLTPAESDLAKKIRS